MTPEEILARPAKILSRGDRERYFEHGYVGTPSVVSGTWLDRIQSCSQHYVDESRHVNDTDKRFDLEPDHTAEQPRIRRLNSPVDADELFWEFASTGPFVDIAEDLLGPDIKFHHSKLNYKWSGGGEEVKWHQDIQFWPHTNYDVLTVGVYLDDVAADMAPMGVIPGSHQGPLYDLYDHDNEWTGHIRSEDVPNIGAERRVTLPGRLELSPCITVAQSTGRPRIGVIVRGRCFSVRTPRATLYRLPTSLHEVNTVMRS